MWNIYVPMSSAPPEAWESIKESEKVRGLPGGKNLKHPEEGRVDQHTLLIDPTAFKDDKEPVR